LKYRLAALALIASLLTPAPAAMAAPTADEELYVKTVATMRALPEPAYITFITNVDTDGVDRIDLADAHGFEIAFRLGNGHAHASYPVSYRTNDELASIANKPGHHFVSHSPAFSPTWDGTYDLMRYGIVGRPVTPAPATPEPATPEPADSGVVVIGIAQVIGINFYRITQADAAKCPDGSQGRHLHLEALTDPVRHPLTDATIDPTSQRFCSMRFGTAYLIEEVHFGDVNGYWMTTSMERTLYFRGGSHWGFRFTYQNVRYPDTLDAALFVAQR
jgi:hypothetical protein